MSDRVLAGVVYPGRTVTTVDDENAIVTCEGCGHSAAFARTDGRPLTACDLNELLLLPCGSCEPRSEE